MTSLLRRPRNERVQGSFNANNFHVIVRKDDAYLLEQMNDAIDQLNAVEGDWKYRLNDRYYNHLEFTAEGRVLIRQYVGRERPC